MESSLLVICWNSKDISLDGLDKELEEHKNYDVSLKPTDPHSPSPYNNGLN